jgi:hypothetical protein
MKATASEIDQKLRDDFRRYIREYGIEAPEADPILAVLFRTFASQIHSIYSDTDRMRTSILDELIEGLGFVSRFARPAQTIVKYQGGDANPINLADGTALRCYGEVARGLTFVSDYSISVSAARVACAFTYQGGQLRLISDMELPSETTQAVPSYDSFPARLGPCPAFFIAVENLSQIHLSNHGIYIQVDSGAIHLRKILTTENWCLSSGDGIFRADGIFRPRPLNAGQHELDWLIGPAAFPSTDVEPTTPRLPDGHWQGRCFRFPEIPVVKRWTCQVPQGLEAPLGRVFENAPSFLSTPRAWLRIQFPEQIEPLHTALRAVYLNCQSASNVECLNQTVRFPQSTVPISREGGTDSLLVAPLSITGESGRSYLPEFEPTLEPGAGRFGIKQGNLTLTPSISFNGRPDSYVTIRSWMTAGKSGNQLEMGTLNSFDRPAASPGLRCTNITQAAGGTDGKAVLDADEAPALLRARLAEAILSRERLTTRADFESSCRALDSRVVSFDIRPELTRGSKGLSRSYHITILCDRSRFTDPSEEGRILASDLEAHLKRRSPFDVELTVELGWREAAV